MLSKSTVKLIIRDAGRYTIYSLALAASSLMLFVISNQEGPTVDESRDAADRAVEMLRVMGQKNTSAQRCYESLIALSRGGEGESGGMSPRTYFFTALGAREDSSGS